VKTIGFFVLAILTAAVVGVFLLPPIIAVENQCRLISVVLDKPTQLTWYKVCQVEIDGEWRELQTVWIEILGEE